MDTVLLAAFADELGKIAAAPPTDVLHAIRAALPRAQRIFGDAPLAEGREALIRHTRSEMKHVLPEVPFATRLQSYKNYNETGHLGPMRAVNDKGNVEFWHLPVQPGAVDRVTEPALSKSNDLVTLYSHGADQSLAKAIKDPGTRLDHPVLRPGQTRLEQHGMYFTEDPAAGARYAGRGQGAPARLEMQVPRSKILSFDVKGGERVVPSDVVRQYAGSAKITPQWGT